MKGLIKGIYTGIYFIYLNIPVYTGIYIPGKWFICEEMFIEKLEDRVMIFFLHHLRSLFEAKT